MSLLNPVEKRAEIQNFSTAKRIIMLYVKACFRIYIYSQHLMMSVYSA